MVIDKVIMPLNNVSNSTMKVFLDDFEFYDKGRIALFK